MQDVIATQELSKRYQDAFALDGVSLNIPYGSIYGILGIESTRLRDKHFESIGFVSESQEFPDWMTIRFLLDYLKRFYPGWDDSRAGELLTQFDLPADQKLKNLSRGMKMKTYLAAA